MTLNGFYKLCYKLTKLAWRGTLAKGKLAEGCDKGGGHPKAIPTTTAKPLVETKGCQEAPLWQRLLLHNLRFTEGQEVWLSRLLQQDGTGCVPQLRAQPAAAQGCPQPNHSVCTAAAGFGKNTSQALFSERIWCEADPTSFFIKFALWKVAFLKLSSASKYIPVK